MEDKDITLKIKLSEVELILEGLNELPRKRSNNLFISVNQSTREQIFLKPVEPEKKEYGTN